MKVPEVKPEVETPEVKPEVEMPEVEQPAVESIPFKNSSPDATPFKASVPSRPLKIVPSDWFLTAEDDIITAVNTHSGDTFKGTREEFNEFMKG